MNSSAAQDGETVKQGGSRRPVVRLRPKKGGRFFAGAPWVYADELAMDRRTRGLEPGTVAVLEDSERKPLATVTLNPASKIAVRLLDRDPEAEINASWFEAKLRAALDLRERLFDAPFYRLIHAEADGLPGVIIDRFGSAVTVQPNAAWAETRRTALLAALDRVLAPEVVVWNGGSRARSLEGLPSNLRVMKGALEAPVEVPMNGAIYLADLIGGQKTGLFYDQRPNQAFFASLAKDRTVLDAFCHVGGFALAALAGGAAQAVALDSSAPALELARAGAGRMGAEDRLETRHEDAFDAMRALAEEARLFDCVVCDPPAFAPNRGALEAGRRAYEKTARLGIRLTAPGGIFMMCSCSHALETAMLEEAVANALRRAGRSGRLLRRGGAGPDHPAHPHLSESEYLKTLCYQVD